MYFSSLLALVSLSALATGQDCNITDYYTCVSANIVGCGISCTNGELDLIETPGNCTQEPTYCSLAACCPTCAESVIEYKNCMLADCVTEGCDSIPTTTTSPSSPPSGGSDITLPPFVDASCADDNEALRQCIMANPLECLTSCLSLSNTTSTGSICGDLQDACESFICCPSCAALGMTVVDCSSTAASCDSIDCTDTTPSAPSPAMPFSPAMLTFPPFTFPPLNPSNAHSDDCQVETMGWYGCLASTAPSCEGSCDNVTAASEFNGCDSIGVICDVLTCCTACANEGKAYGACLASIFECSSNCGSFSPIAPTTADFPSISNSGMPMMEPSGSTAPSVESSSSPFPAGEVMMPSSGMTPNPPVDMMPTTTSAPVGNNPTAPNVEMSDPSSAPSVTFRPSNTPTLRNENVNQAKTAAPTNGSFSYTTIWSVLVATMMGVAVMLDGSVW
ncbi:hypothetical protein MHU86_20961 [Fragilaria crotonensis]|nr:hypothetical protein MHU86_20961 [Fragilaria crotonensis]